MTNLDADTAAASLYGAPATSPAPSAMSNAPSPPNARDAADKLYSAAEPDATLGAEGLHGALSAYAPAARDIEAAAIDRLGLSVEEARASASEWGQTFHRYGASSDDAAHLTEVGIAALAHGVDEEKANAWRNESQAVLTSEFGAGAGQALEDAKRLVAADPALAAWLDQTGLGNHPKVVATIAKQARQLRNSGRLK